MIAAVEGGVHNGRTLTAADVAAISGCTEEELEKYFHGTSRYVRVSAKANNSITIEEDGLYVAVPDAYTKSETDAKIKKVQDQLDGHSKDAVVHITAEERKAWNAKVSQDELTAAKSEVISAAAADATKKADAARDTAKTYADGLNTAMDNRVKNVEGALTWKAIDDSGANAET